MHLLLRWILSVLSLILVAYLVPGIEVESLFTALIAALILGLANALIRPILLLLTLPINILTLGLFTFVVNGLMLWLTATVVAGFEIATFTAAVWAALVLWLVGWIVNGLFEHTESNA